MRKYLVVVGMGIVAFLAGCNQATSPLSGTGTLQVKMIDSPAAYDEVNIFVDSVQAHSELNDSTSGWYTLNSTPASYNLLTLVNGVSALIGDAELPVGRYSQIRLFIGSGSNIKAGGSTYPLVTPSGSQSGVKLNVNAEIEADVTYTLTLDFDANGSVVKTGNPQNPQYILKPVIRVVTTATTGIISGLILPDSVLCAVWAFGTQDTVSTATDTSGAFRLVSLAPDVYSVQIVPTSSAYKDTALTGVTVTAGATTDLGVVALSPN